jgi:glycosyltransferase involved in cell wall biosynthesis
MRIAFIGQKGFPATWGGVEVHVHRVATELAKRGHQVTVFNRRWYSGGAPSRSSFEGVRIVDAPSARTSSLDALSHSFISSVLALREPFDVIHYHCMGPSLMAWLPAMAGRTVVSTIHGPDYQAAKWGVLARTALHLGEWSALHAATKTTVVARHLQARYAARGKETAYIPNGVDPVVEHDISHVPAQHRLARGQYLLFLARLEENKGAHELIEAFHRCRQRGLFSGFKLVIAGDAAAGNPYGPTLRKQPADDVWFAGQVSGALKNALLTNAAAFVTPSWLEGLPISLLEAMSAGIPCIASDIPAHRELLEDQIHGYLHTARSVDALEAALVRFATLSESALGRSSMAARERSRQYTWQGTTRALEALYAEAVAAT